MSSFFTAPASQRKRKRTDDRAGKPIKRRGVESDGQEDRRATEQSRRQKTTTRRDDSISGSDSEGEVEPETGSESEATSEEDETAAERRVRLAQRYLENIRQEVDEAGFDAEEIDKDLIAQRLRQDVDEQKGRQFRLIASTLDFENAHCTHFRADTQSTTAVAVRQPFAYTVSKDKTLIKWQLMAPSTSEHTNGALGKMSKPLIKRKPKQVGYVKGVRINTLSPQHHGHSGAILSVAVSPDGKYVATGGADKKLIIWRAEDLTPIKTFTTHRDAVTGLDFAPTSSQSGFGAQLFSASTDRSLKTYSLAGEESIAYVETLFGHQDDVLAVSAMGMDLCVSVGARDRSARLWRVVDETQLKFLGDSSRRDEYHIGSLDCVAALPPHHFVTGSDAGSISLWSIHKKKAMFTIHTAHGIDQPPPLEDVTSESVQAVIDELKAHDKRRPKPRAITALVALPGTDVVLSGSWDGYIRVWKVSDDKRSLISCGVIGSHELSTSEPESSQHPNGIITAATNGNNSISHQNHDTSEHSSTATNKTKPQTSKQPPIRGIINSLALFERRKEITSEFGGTKQGDTLGLCVVAGVGKEMRMGRWMKIPGGRNGAVVCEVPLLSSSPSS